MLEPMDAERKAYHLIGGVLAERKVGDVKPILRNNREAVSPRCARRANRRPPAAFLRPHHRSSYACPMSPCILQIQKLIQTWNDQLKETNAERTALQKKHGIRVVSREQAERIAAEQAQRQALSTAVGGAAPEGGAGSGAGAGAGAAGDA